MEKLENTVPCSEKQADSEGESKDIISFEKSLQELKDLSSQLHYAAEYCESTFLAAQEKRSVVENTKDEFSDAELRIDCLKQRILLCEQFTRKLALTRTRWSETWLRHSARFLAAPDSAIFRDDEKSNEDIKDSGNPTVRKTIGKHEFDRQGSMPLFLYTHSHKPSLSKDNANSALVPVCDGVSILSRGPNPTFHFQEITRKNGRNIRKSGQAGDFLSLIRRTKRAI